jgi:hypothetical protein
MPLLKYFTTVSLLLTVLLLLTDALRERSSATARDAATARREANLPKPKIYSRVGERAVDVPRTTIALATQARTEPTEAPRPLSKPSAREFVAAPEPSVNANAAPDTVKKTKPPRKTAKVRTRRQDNDVAWRYPDSHPGYLSYAQERRGWPFFPQTSPRARPANPVAQGGVTRPFFGQGGGRWN